MAHTAYPHIAQFLQFFAQTLTGVTLGTRSPEDIWEDFSPTPLQVLEDELKALSTEDIQMVAAWQPSPGEVVPVLSPAAQEITSSFMQMLWDEEEEEENRQWAAANPEEAARLARLQEENIAYIQGTLSPEDHTRVAARIRAAQDKSVQGAAPKPDDVKHRAQLRNFAAFYGVL